MCRYPLVQCFRWARCGRAAMGNPGSVPRELLEPLIPSPWGVGVFGTGAGACGAPAVSCRGVSQCASQCAPAARVAVMCAARGVLQRQMMLADHHHHREREREGESSGTAGTHGTREAGRQIIAAAAGTHAMRWQRRDASLQRARLLPLSQRTRAARFHEERTRLRPSGARRGRLAPEEGASAAMDSKRIDICFKSPPSPRQRYLL